jgi:hypothetical protein
MLGCKVCGFPVFHRHFIQWNDNGTITLSLRRDFRVLILEADFLTRLIEAIEDEVDLPVRRMIFEAERNSVRAAMDADLSDFHGLAKRWPFKRLTLIFFDHLAVWCGQCYSRVVRYKSGESGDAIIRNPFDRELMAAIAVGALESMEGVPMRHTWKKRGMEDLLCAETEPGRAGRAEPIPFETVPLKPGHHRVERCSRCGTPLAMRDLKWLESEGVIMDVRKGVRVVFLDFHGCQAVLDRLAQELGPSFAPIVVDTQRAFFLRHIWEEFLSERRSGEPPTKQELYRQVLDTLALRGQGNPVEHALEGERFSVTIENPFDRYLLAGFLSALYECSEGVIPEVKWERPDEQTLRFELVPREATTP